MVPDIAFNPASLGERAAMIPVQHIYLAALAPEPACATGRSRKPTSSAAALSNRWVLHFSQTNRTSIRLDPKPSGKGAAQISIAFTELDDGIPADIVKTYDLPILTGMTLATVLEILDKGRFDRYRFDASGHGCRYWIWSMVGFLKENGFVASALPHDGARASLQQVWLEDGKLANEDQQTHLVPGEFY
ncbi:hypothetical protein MBLNU459_g2644t1 [Dothideomycetes sp. NU459]